MARKRYSPEQIIAKLREADVALAEGASVKPHCYGPFSDRVSGTGGRMFSA